MASTDIRWSCTGPDEPFSSIAENQLTIVYGCWAETEGYGSDAAKAVAEDYFDTSTWEEWFGEDDDARVRITITEPVSVKGTYDVDMERVVRATATLLSSA